MPMPSADRAAASVRYLSPAIFTIPMSFAGLALPAQRIEESAGWRAAMSNTLLVLAIATLLVVTLAYGLKIARHTAAALADWRHPILISFFAPYGMTLVLIAAGLLELRAPLAHPIWIAGTALLAVTALATLAAWITRGGIEPGHLLPVWFLPLVGPTLIAQAGVRLGHPEIAGAALGFAVLGWLGFLPLMLQRLVFGPALPPVMLPSLAIIVAPEALIFISWTEVTGGLTEMSRLMYGVTTVMGALVLVLAPRLLSAPFSLAWWALSFPIAAWCAATLRYAALTGSGFHLQAGRTIFVGVVAMTTLLALRTLHAALRGDLTRPPA